MVTALASPRSEYLARLSAGFQAYRTKRFADADVFDPVRTVVFHKAHRPTRITKRRSVTGGMRDNVNEQAGVH